MKKLLSMLLAVVIVSSVILSFQIPVSAESLYIRKIVSVVYDDSGSMIGPNAAYANYAIQAFCGMLNSEDQLYITYMSTLETSKVDLSSGGIQSSVDTIRSQGSNATTPYEAVKKAFDKLKNVKDSNPNTQYWLVVFTDGAFNECGKMSESERKYFLNDEFEKFAETTMPNGTNPQCTFFGIGNVVTPDENQSKGIYTYSASDAKGITVTMSKMADRISGRTRLESKDIKQIDSKTLQISSSIPLLNIAVLSQGSSAKITKAVYSNEVNIPIGRKVSLYYPNYFDLVGGAYLIGDSQTVIGSGTYNITFDQDVNASDVVFLFEPALEMRMTLTLNGKEVTDRAELKNVMEGDKVSVSCKIYEMGTDTEIDPSLLPPGTKFEVKIFEGGNVVQNISGEDMILSDYIVNKIETEITAAVIIDGFNPIDYSVKFTPTEYVPKVVYTMSADYGNTVKSVKFDRIATNSDLCICFTVYADGVAVTDTNAVKSLNPVISVSPQGNSGDITYSSEGKIVFTPKVASVISSGVGSFDVEVVCTLSDGTTAKSVYTVLMAEYQVISIGTTDTIKKTDFFGNQVAVSFYITKDGVKLSKAEVENHITALLNDQHSELKNLVDVSNDGTITITPYSEEEHKMTFWNWWTNWAYYFGLEGDDVVVTLNHAYGTANATIDVVPEDLSYQIWNVYAPLTIELVALIMLVTWIILIVTKPRYMNSATLFVGEIRYNKESDTHILRNFAAVKLVKFNKVKRGNGRLKFKRTADIVSANGIKIRADHGGRIICEMQFPWYMGKVEPVDSFIKFKNPAEISEYIIKHKKLEINEFATTETVNGEFKRALAPANPRNAKYIVVPDSGSGVGIVDDKRVIKSGKLFIYINE